MIRGHHSWVSAHGFRSDEHKVYDHYFKCDAILDLDSTFDRTCLKDKYDEESKITLKNLYQNI
jgi:hypothetical protein